MANQQDSYTGSQGTGTNNADFSFTFPSFTTSEVKVEVDNVVKTLTTHYTVENYNTTSGGTVRFTAGNIPTGTTPVRIFRQTDVDNPKATFTAGSSLKAGEINDNFKQVRHALQEAIGALATDRKVQRFNIEADAIDGTLIADDVVDSEHYVAGSIDLEHMSANSVDSDQYVDGSIDGVHIANDQIDSQHYAAGSIDLEHMSANSVDSDQYVDGSIDLIHMSANSVDSDQYVDGSIDRVHLEADIIDGTKLADNAVNSEHYVDGSIDHEHLANDVIDGDNIQDDVVNSEHIAAGALDNEHYAAGSITSDKLNGATVVTNAEQAAASVNDTSFFTTSASDARYFNISSGDTIKDGQTFPDNDTTIATTAAINDRIIDLVDDVGGFVPIANETSFPTSNPDVNNGTGTLISIKEISSTRTPSTGTVTIANGSGSNTVTITGCGSTVLTAGFGAIVETTTTLHTYTFHRLSPKATEVTTVAGVSGNVTTVAGIASNVTTVAGIASDVTTVAGVSSNVTTVAGSISSVNNASSNINSIANFGDQYQVASSNPSTDGGGNSLAEGDLYFNTTANELKVYNGSQWQGGVTASGNFAAITGNTFTGDNVYADNAKLKLGTGSDLEIFHNTNDSIINDAGTGDLKIQSGGSTKIQVTSSGAEVTGNLDVSSGVDVTGNITVTGTVDGVDIAALNTTVGNITTDVVSDTTPQLGGDLASNGHDIKFADDDKAIFGTGTGNDLEIFHESSSNTNEIKAADGGIHIQADNFMLISDDTGGRAIYLNDSGGYLELGFDGNHDARFAGNQVTFLTNVDANAGLDVTGNITVTGTVDGIDIATDVAANTAKVTNATHTGEVTGATALTIADDVVDEANLKISNAGSDGQFLSKQSGNTGGLTWATVTTDLVGDTSPQLGGELDTNNFDIKLSDGEKLKLHNYGEIKTKTGATNAVVNGLTGYVLQNSTVIDSSSYDLWLSSTGGKKITFGTADSTTHEVMRVQCAAVGASQHGFVNLNYVTANAGQNASSDTKLATTSTGINVTGNVVLSNALMPSADSSSDIGTTSVRWRNIYADTLYGDGSNLTGISTSPTADTGGAIFENSQTISANHTIPSGSNGMSAGPVTVNNNITLTISNGSTYTIV